MPGEQNENPTRANDHKPDSTVKRRHDNPPTSMNVSGTASAGRAKKSKVAGVNIDRIGKVENLVVANGAGTELSAAQTPISAAEEQNIRIKYLRFVVEHCGKLEPRGIAAGIRTVTLPLDQVYVSLNADHEHGGTVEGLEFPKAVTDHTRIVLLGKPGCGKTTMARFLAAQFARACLKNAGQVTDNAGHTYGPPLIPVYLRVADYAKALDQNPKLDLLDFLVDGCECRRIVREKLASLFQKALDDGLLFVLLDGLDEVRELGKRSEVREKIEQFITNYVETARILVTSRTAGYLQAALGGRFKTLTIRDMDQDQIMRFVHNWCLAVERFHNVDGDETGILARGQAEADTLCAAILKNPNVYALASNPLLVTTLALIHRNTKRLPERRADLYQAASDTLLRDWQTAKPGGADIVVTKTEEETLLRPLALWMHEHKDTGRIGWHEVVTKLRELYVADRGLPGVTGDVITAINDFWERLVVHSGLFLAYPPDEYGFLHLTFEEYMAGQALVSNYATAETEIRKYRHRARWEEPIRLAIALQTRASAASFIRNAIWCPENERSEYRYEPSQYEDDQRRDLFLAALCLSDYNGIEPGLIQSVVQEMVAICLNNQDAGLANSLQDRMWNTFTTMSGGEAKQKIVAALIESLKNKGHYAWQHVQFLFEKHGYESLELETALRTALADIDAPLTAGWLSDPQYVSNTRARVIAELARILQDPDWQQRANAAIAVGRIANSSPVQLGLLLPVLKDNDVNVRSAAARALATAGKGSPEIVQALIEALMDEASRVQRAAAETLGRLVQASPEVVRALLSALLDRVGFVRRAAAEALGRLGQASPEVVQALLQALGDEDSDVRSAAAEALGSLGRASPEIAQALLQALSDEDSDVRRAAAEALCDLRQASPEIVQALLRAHADKDSGVRWAAALALGRLGQASPEIVQALLKVLKDEAGDGRWAAAGALGRLGQALPEIVQALLQALSDEDSGVRRAAAEALRNLGRASPEIVQALLRAHADKDSGVRWAAASALGRLGQASPEIVQALLQALSDENSDVRRAAALALRSLRQVSPEVVRALLQALSDEDSGVRWAAALALGRLGQASPEVVRALLQALSDEDSDVRSAAAETLGRLGQASPEVVQALLRVHADKDSDVRRAAAEALCDLGQASPEIVQALLQALSDEDSDVRSAAAEALGRLGQASPEVVQALLRVHADKDSDVRRAAAEALGRLGQASSEIVQALLKALQDEDSDVRQTAAETLGRLGQASPEIVQALLQALSDEDSDVRRAAAEALGRLGQASPEVVQALLQALSDEDSDVRRAAAEALCDFG